MPDSRAFPVNPNVFNFNDLVNQITYNYQIQGYKVFIAPLNDYSVTIIISKNQDGVNYIFGRCIGAKINLTYNNGNLIVNRFEDKWGDKIVGFFAGLFLGFITCFLLFWIPWIFTGIGIYEQVQFQNNVFPKIHMFLSNQNYQYNQNPSS